MSAYRGMSGNFVVGMFQVLRNHGFLEILFRRPRQGRSMYQTIVFRRCL